MFFMIESLEGDKSKLTFQNGSEERNIIRKKIKKRKWGVSSFLRDDRNVFIYLLIFTHMSFDLQKVSLVQPCTNCAPQAICGL